MPDALGDSHAPWGKPGAAAFLFERSGDDTCDHESLNEESEPWQL